MPPARARAFAEDAKVEGPGNKDRSTNSVITGSRPRKTAAVAVLAGNSGKDSASNASSNTAVAMKSNAPQAGSPGIAWALENPSLLHAYRTAYRLDAPPSFHSALNAAILNAPGIGKHSPTMARRKEKRKMPKDQLALAVRKHFNGLAINETDVVVDFLYAVKTQDRGFKLRFMPRRQR